MECFTEITIRKFDITMNIKHINALLYDCQIWKCELYGHLGFSSISPLTVCLLSCNSFRQLLQSLLQLQREFLVALLAHWLHVKLHKLVPVEERVTATVTGCKLDVITPSMYISVSMLCLLA